MRITTKFEQLQQQEDKSVSPQAIIMVTDNDSYYIHLQLNLKKQRILKLNEMIIEILKLNEIQMIIEIIKLDKIIVNDSTLSNYSKAQHKQIYLNRLHSFLKENHAFSCNQRTSKAGKVINYVLGKIT